MAEGDETRGTITSVNPVVEKPPNYKGNVKANLSNLSPDEIKDLKGQGWEIGKAGKDGLSIFNPPKKKSK